MCVYEFLFYVFVWYVHVCSLQTKEVVYLQDNNDVVKGVESVDTPSPTLKQVLIIKGEFIIKSLSLFIEYFLVRQHKCKYFIINILYLLS